MDEGCRVIWPSRASTHDLANNASFVRLRRIQRYLGKDRLIDWTVAAILSAVLFAVLNITDKIIMTGLGLRVRSFLLFIGFQTLLTVAIIAAVNPFPSMSAEIFARGLGAGLLWGIGSPLILWLNFFNAEGAEVRRGRPRILIRRPPVVYPCPSVSVRVK